MAAYYNEFDPYAAQWLRNLIKAGSIAPGDVDERSITDVKPEEIEKYTQCHFFAGIGVWSYALRRAGWPDDRPVWTGSCPCQPFSGAGKRKGFSDERHLWPAWFNLIRERRPSIILGEQVASKDGLAWLDDVQADLENAGYAVGALDLCAAGFGAPHWRQRLYLSAIRMADADSKNQVGRRVQRSGQGNGANARAACERSAGFCTTGELDNAARIGHGPDQVESIAGRRECTARPADGAYAAGEPPTSPVNGFWRDADWLFCRDGKWRPVESGTFPLAHGAANRVAQLRAYGNAIVAPQATEFVRVVMEAIGDEAGWQNHSGSAWQAGKQWLTFLD